MFSVVAQGTSVDLAGLLVEFLKLAGFATLVTVLINVGKTLGWVKDGAAPNISLGFNLVGLVALYALRLFRPDADMGYIDGVLGTLAQIVTLVAGLVVQLGASKLAHKAVQGTPVIGKSFSYECAELLEDDCPEGAERG